MLRRGWRIPGASVSRIAVIEPGVKVKTVLRMVLIFCILRMMNSLGFFPPRFSSFHASPAVSAYEAQGMGMSYPEYVPIETAVDDTTPEPPELFLAGVPEPPEYSKPRMLLYTPYTVVQGDTIGEIAHNFGLNQDTLLSLNDIKNSRLLRIGQVLKIPNQDGILYQVKPGDTLTALAERNGTTVPAIQTANELFSETINAGSRLFIPGARLDRVNLQEINGDLFTWPVRGYVTSPYGYRPSPFTGLRQFHSGLDIGAPMGTPIRAAMAGRVSATGEDAVTGNYVVITHHSGYRTLYGHLSLIRVKAGAYVRAGERIGDVGSTGLSTGPHLHFTVYKNGVTVNPRALMN